MTEIKNVLGKIYGNGPGSEPDHTVEKKTSEKQNQVKDLLLKELADKVPENNYSEFVIRTIKKSVKREDILVRQVLYTGLSTYTMDPINLGLIAPTAEGKTYVVTQVMKYFPKEDIRNIGSMSTKVLVRQKGILVDSNNGPIGDRVNALRREITLLGDNRKSLEKKVDLLEELKELIEGSKTLIELSGRILVFLEPPHHELWNLLKPILSHDVPDIEFPYVDKTEKSGIQTKKVVVRGWPACIFCSAKDESGWEIWPEIQSRFLITSPNMNKQKYFESNVLIAQRKGLPNLLQQHIIVSDSEIELAKKSVLLLKVQIKNYFDSDEVKQYKATNAVWIPYQEILGSTLSSSRGTDNRVTNRIFSLLNVIALAKGNLRAKLIYGKEQLVIASLEDLSEVLHITQNISGMPTHKIQFYSDIFLPLYGSKGSPDIKDDKVEKRIAVTTTQLREYYRERTGKSLTTNNIKQTYLNELINNGYLDEEESEIDRRGKIYFPLIEIPKEKISNCNNFKRMDNFLHYPKVIMPSFCSKIPENWLNVEVLNLIKYPVEIDKFQLIDYNGNETCICNFVQEYEKKEKLSGYFVNGENANITFTIFGKLQLVDNAALEPPEKLSSNHKILQNDNSEGPNRDRTDNTVSFKSVDSRLSLSSKGSMAVTRQIQNQSTTPDNSHILHKDENQDAGHPLMQSCPKCGEEIEAFYMRIHRCEA